MSQSGPAGARPKDRSPLEWFLNLFAEVKSGEGLTAVLLTLNVFLLLTTYYIIKPVREALILAGEGAEVKSYASAGMAILLVFLIPAYARLASHVNRRALINIVTLFFAACIVLFYVWAVNSTFRVPLGFANLTVGVAFFLWVGIFNVMIVAQFWSFANDIYTPEEGKRLFAIVAFGASAGAVLGSEIAKRLIDPLGVERMLPVAAAILVATLAITNWIDARERRRLAAHAAERDAHAAEESIGKGKAFRLVWSNRYLLLIAFLILFLNWVNTTGEYILGRVVSADAEAKVASGAAGGLTEKDLVGKFYAGFFSVVNIVGLATQLFLVSRILKWFGIRFAILALPVVAMGGYAMIAFTPVLSIIRWVKIAENSIDYSLNNTVRHALFLPTTREQKYNAKQVIDTVFWRAGDVLSAVIVFLGTQALAFQTQHFAMVNLALVLVWLLIAMAIGRENAKMTGER
jgi:AAA family ATP:ADP antiporter